MRLFGKLRLKQREIRGKKGTHKGPGRTHAQKRTENTLNFHSGLIIRLKGLLISEGLPDQSANTGRGICSFKWQFSTGNHKAYRETGKYSLLKVAK